MDFFLTTPELDNRQVYITGNFNNWNPQDPNFQLKELDEGSFYLHIEDSLLPENIEFKFTKGGWENVEIDRYGNITTNRKVKKAGSKSESMVERWRINWGPFKKEFFPIVELISNEFYIPQLDKTRKSMGLAAFRLLL